MMPLRMRPAVLCIVVGLCYVEWAALLSLPPLFYPLEAEEKGATPSQVKMYQSCRSIIWEQTIMWFLLIDQLINQLIHNEMRLFVSYTTKLFVMVGCHCAMYKFI